MQHRTIITTLAATALALGLVAPSANAADTDATFDVTVAGSLTISVPASTVDLGDVAAGSLTFAPNLGTVTVTDTRNLLAAAWTATASGTHFDLQGATATPATDPNQRVADIAIAYGTGTITVTGDGTATPTLGSLAVDSTVVFAGVGNNTATWNPTLTMTLLATQMVGTYKGTVTHSVL